MTEKLQPHPYQPCDIPESEMCFHRGQCHHKGCLLSPENPIHQPRNLNLEPELAREIGKALFIANELDRELSPGYVPAHSFQGRSDRDCEVCGYPDRNPIHQPVRIAQEAIGLIYTSPLDRDPVYQAALGCVTELAAFIRAAERLIASIQRTPAERPTRTSEDDTYCACCDAEYGCEADCEWVLFVSAFTAINPKPFTTESTESTEEKK